MCCVHRFLLKGVTITLCDYYGRDYIASLDCTFLYYLCYFKASSLHRAALEGFPGGDLAEV